MLKFSSAKIMLITFSLQLPFSTFACKPRDHMEPKYRSCTKFLSHCHAYKTSPTILGYINEQANKLDYISFFIFASTDRMAKVCYNLTCGKNFLSLRGYKKIYTLSTSTARAPCSNRF